MSRFRKMRRIAFLIPLILLCLLITYFFLKPVIRQTSIQNDYKNMQSDFLKIAEILNSHDDQFIYAKRENIIDDDRAQTVNSKVSIELFNSSSGVNLEKVGYRAFEKTNGGIYFCKYYDVDRIRGVMYYPNGFRAEFDELVTKCEELSPNWYYFEQE